MSRGGLGTAAPVHASAGSEGDPRGRELGWSCRGYAVTGWSYARGYEGSTVSGTFFFFSREFNQNRTLKAQSFFHKPSCSHGNLGAIYTKPTLALEFHFIWTTDIVKEV